MTEIEIEGNELERIPTTPQQPSRSEGIKTALIYAAVGAVWIAFSGLVAGLIFGRSGAALVAQSITGWLFVGASALLFYLIAGRNAFSAREFKKADVSSGRMGTKEALERAQEVCEALVEGTMDAIFMVDRDRNITSVNRAFLELLGFSKEEVIGRSVRIMHPSDESFLDFGKLRSTLEQAPLRVEWELRKKDGTVFPVEGTFSLIKGPEGTIEGHVGIVRDITQRKKADKELREYRDHLEEMVRERTRELSEAQAALVQREKLKTLDATAAECAHEFRNPLVSIGGFALRLLKKYPDSTEAKIIVRETERLETMLNRVREYLRPVEMKPRECHVNAILTDSVRLLTPELEKDNVRILLNLYPDLPTAHVDPSILTHVFVVMIRNTVEMMGMEKELTLKTHYGEHNVYVDMISPVAGERQWDSDLALLPFEESGEEAAIVSTFKLLKEMGGTLSFSKRDSMSVFTVSLVKCREAGAGETAQEKQSG